MKWLDRAYASFARNVVFRVHERAKGHSTFQMLSEMNREQWLPPEQLHAVQQQRLQALVAHAFATVPYYQEISRSLKLAAHDFKGASDLVKLPFLSKAVIRNRLEDLKSQSAKKVERFTTGGSTGAPLAFWLGPTRVSSDVAARCRAESWWGVGIGDREYVFWGSPLELTKQDRMREMRDRLLRTRLMSAFEMSPRTMDSYLEEMQRHGCVRIFGYPSSIFFLCEYARRTGKDLSRLGVRAVFVTAEYLWDHWRQTISEAFACKVANGYGGRDSGFIAQECPSGGMHITADRILVEIVDDHGQPLPPGELGEIIVTHLDTPEMPFIRYRTGDVGALSRSPCSCGRTLPLLEMVEGRKSDFIVAPDGRRMHGLSVIYILRKIAGVEQFRITQTRVDRFDIDLVTDSSFRRDSEVEIRAEFEKRMRAPVQVNLRYCNAMPVSNSGKYRYVISEVEEAQGSGTPEVSHS
jgi:phenylacetate-CoA ligase